MRGKAELPNETLKKRYWYESDLWLALVWVQSPYIDLFQFVNYVFFIAVYGYISVASLKEKKCHSLMYHSYYPLLIYDLIFLLCQGHRSMKRWNVCDYLVRNEACYKYRNV